MTLSEIYNDFLNGKPIRRAKWDNEHLYIVTSNKGDTIRMYHDNGEKKIFLKAFVYTDRFFTFEDVEPTTRDWHFYNEKKDEISD
jgi:hypothetical protein